MKTITYIPTVNKPAVKNKKGNSRCLLNSVSEMPAATFTVSKNGTFESLGVNIQIYAGDNSTMKVDISDDTLIAITIECTVMRRFGIPMDCPSIYVTKGNGTTRTSVQVTESDMRVESLFNVKDYTLTYLLKSPKEKGAVIHFGKEKNIIKKITLTTT